MKTVNEHVDVKYDNQKEFAEHLPEMLEKGFAMTGANFSKKYSNVFTVFYTKQIIIED